MTSTIYRKLFQISLVLPRTIQIKYLITLTFSLISALLSSFSVLLTVPAFGALLSPSSEPSGTITAIINYTNIDSIVLFVIFSFLSITSNYFSSLLAVKTSCELTSSLSILAYKKYLLKDYIHIKSINTADIILTLSGRLNGISNVFQSLTEMPRQVFSSILILISLASIDFRTFSFILFIVLGIYSFTIKTVNTRFAFFSSEVDSRSHKQLKSISEDFKGIRDIKLAHIEYDCITDYSVNDLHLRQKYSKMNSLLLIPRFVLEFLAYSLLSFILIFSQSVDGSNYLVLAASMLFGFQKLLPFLQQSVTSWSVLHGNNQSINIYHELLVTSSIKKASIFSNLLRLSKKLTNTIIKHIKKYFTSTCSEPIASTFTNSNYNSIESDDIEKRQIKFIDLKNICFSYGASEPILKEINLSISQYDHVVLTGSSGTGKSTLLDITLGLLLPQNGDLFYKGRKISSSDELTSYQKNICYISQACHFYDDSILFNIYPHLRQILFG